ncbi:MAG: competence/damage-inducible protein A, partial [Chloroflexi bacterium]|nr:competence/damage-inducible protein A [Chloroflexota bacterium]
MQAEIVTIGTELLLGEIVDTNSAWIAQRLTTIGLNLYYTTTVGDNLGRITQVLKQALERSDVVITTGGLGPTVDDVTREAVAAATERDLVLDPDLLEEITAYFAR